MDQEEWEKSLKNMKNILKKKKKVLRDHTYFMEKDIAELEFVISCYKQKIESFK